MKFSNPDFQIREFQSAYIRCLQSKRREMIKEASKLWELYRETFGGFHSRIPDIERIGAIVADSNKRELIALHLKRPGETVISKADLAERIKLLKRLIKKNQRFCENYYFALPWMKTLISDYVSFLLKFEAKNKMSFEALKEFSVSGDLADFKTRVSRVIKGNPFSFKFDAWDATEDSEDYLTRITDSFNAELERYLSETDHHFVSKEKLNQSRNLGMEARKQTPEWNVSQTLGLDHLERLVEWNLSPKEKSFKTFVDETRKSEKKGLLRSECDKLKKAFERLKGRTLPVKPMN